MRLVPTLKFTFDVPSLNQDGTVPVLDVRLWAEGERIRHGFFRKPCASKLTIMERSALGHQVKRSTCFQEGMRRLRALDPWTEEEDKVKVMAEFMNTLRVSGYNEAFRFHILKGCLEREKQMQREGLPRYRNREQIDQQKQANKNRFINTWFLKGEHTSVLQVQASRGGRLAKKVKQVVGRQRAPDGGPTMVVEGAGQLVTSCLKKARPLQGDGLPV